MIRKLFSWVLSIALLIVSLSVVLAAVDRTRKPEPKSTETEVEHVEALDGQEAITAE